MSGFMAPLFSESCLNADILPFDFPSLMLTNMLISSE